MMKQVFRLAVFVAVASAFASQASAQALPWEGRGFLNVNFGIQVIAEDTASTTANFQLYDETGTLTSTQAIDKQAPFLDFGGGFRVADVGLDRAECERAPRRASRAHDGGQRFHLAVAERDLHDAGVRELRELRIVADGHGFPRVERADQAVHGLRARPASAVGTRS